MKGLSWNKVWSLPALVIAFIVIADQWTKYNILQSSFLQSGEKIEVIPNFFHIVCVKNPGAAWGILSNHTSMLALVSGAVFIFMTVYYHQLTASLIECCVAISLIMGGIAGNFIDRVYYGTVVDFLSFTYKSFEWPAFNIADSAICVGVAIYLISSLLRPDHTKTLHASTAIQTR